MKVWYTIDRLSIIRNFDLSNKIKRDFFHIDTNKTLREKATWEVHKNAIHSLEQILEATSHKTATQRALTSQFTNHPGKTGTAEKANTNS